MHIIGIQLIDGKDSIIKNLKKKGDKLSDESIFNRWYPFCSYDTDIKEPPEIGSSIQFDINYDFYKISPEGRRIRAPTRTGCLGKQEGSYFPQQQGRSERSGTLHR